MKRFALFLMAAMMITIGQAQNSQQRVVKMPEKMAKLTKSEKSRPSMGALQRQTKTDEMRKAGRKLFATGKQKADNKRTVRKSYDDPIILEQPEGNFVTYSRDGFSYVSTLFGIFYQEVKGSAVTAVFAENNTVYFKNLLSAYECNGWVKGTIDGSKITFKFPQPILETGGYIYYAELLKYDADQQFYIPVADETLTIDYDPATMAITTPAGSAFENGDNLIGLTDTTGEWYGFGDWGFTMTKFESEPVTAPEGLETTQYVIEDENNLGHLLNVGFQGNDIYVQGLYSNLPEGWVKGTINGDIVTFKSGQYIGADTNFQFLVSATEETLYDDYYDEYYTSYVLSNKDITFNYDAASKKLRNGSLFLINAGTEEVYYAEAYKAASISPFTEVAATPATPSILSYTDMGYAYYFEYGYGWGYLDYEIPPTDVDGNFILADKLSYKIYTRVNGEEKELVLSPDNYIYLEEPMTEIPYTFSDSYDIYNTVLYVYMTGVDAYGIQAIYRGAGEERCSEIMWYDLGLEPQPEKETPTYPELDPSNTGSSISYSHLTGDQSIYTIGDKKAQTYDVAIKVQNDALVGTHIDKINFPLVSTENISNLKVWLSTNLRVENGVNVPNLVEVPVTATESGMVEVQLPTPYTISENGVYVGYSLTVDELDDNNMLPIAVIQGANENGLFIHTSDVYLKWMDMSAEINATAYIEVIVSGSSVKENAASPKANEHTYVKVDEPISVSTTIENHGAQGITSLDIDYTLNGNTESKHFDLDEPVAQLMGAKCSVNTEIQGVSELGEYNIDVKVTKVNGVANEDAVSASSSPITILQNVPKHRALLEEYTGTWCGWCPRGFVALEKLAELYPDDYVLVSYHNGDPMEILVSNSISGIDEFPSVINGFPGAWVDRVSLVDPYYGYDNSYEPLGILEPLKDRSKSFGQADIQLTATLSEDLSAVNVNTNVVFPLSYTDADLGLEYVLVADGLTGTGSDWSQSNYYSGESGLDEYLAPFGEADSYIDGLVFNDVAVQVSEKKGISIEGSIPSSITANQPIENKFTFNLNDAVNSSYEPVIQDVTKLKVVAILVNNKTGEVVNANKCIVDSSTGVSIVNGGSSKVVPSACYNIEGRQMSAPQRGLNIIRMNDGSVRKVVVK